MKTANNIFLFLFILLLAGTGVKNLFANPNVLSPIINESKEASEREEVSAKHHSQADQKIKPTGAGGSNIEENELKIFQKSLAQLNSFGFPILLDFEEICFSFKDYHTNLFRSLYFPKLYILFHCTKAFLS